MAERIDPNDVLGMLTGVSSTQQSAAPAVAGSANFYGQFAAQQNANMTQSLQSALRGGAPSKEEQTRDAVSKLDLSKIADLKTLGSMQMAAKDVVGARKTNAEIERLTEKQEAKKAKSALELQQTQAKNTQATAVADALPEGHPLIPAIRAGNQKAIEAGITQLKGDEGITLHKMIKRTDQKTGIVTHVGIDKQGRDVGTFGIASMPSYTTTVNANGTTTVTNNTTGASTTADTVESREEAIFRRTKLESQLNEVNLVLAKVAGARELVEEGAAGWEYNLIQSIPGEWDSNKLAAVVTSLNSTLAFDRLDKMRRESKTGGALGSIAVAELMLLQGALEALDPSAGAEFFNKQLDVVENHYRNYALTLNGKMPNVDYSSSTMPNHTQTKDGTVYYKDPETGTVSKLGKAAIYKKKG